MKYYLEAFSNNLKELIGNMTLSEFSKKVDIPQPTLSRYILCQREISLENLIKIADYFDEDIDYLLGRKDY
ncbi:MAG: helix-turn-helix domain-containing protein [Candidatus Coproplasma sp.]